MKLLPLKLHNKFHNLAVDDMVSTVDTGCTTISISGASPTERSAKAKPKCA